MKRANTRTANSDYGMNSYDSGHTVFYSLLLYDS